MSGTIPCPLANIFLTTLIGAPVSTIVCILILFTHMSTYLHCSLASILVIDNISEGSILLIKEDIAPFKLGYQDLILESGRETETVLTYATEEKVQRQCLGRGPVADLRKVSSQFLEHE